MRKIIFKFITLSFFTVFALAAAVINAQDLKGALKSPEAAAAEAKINQAKAKAESSKTLAKTPQKEQFFKVRYEDISEADKNIYSQAFALASKYPPAGKTDYFTPLKTKYPEFSMAEVVVCTQKSKTITSFLKDNGMDPVKYFAAQAWQNGLNIIFTFQDDSKGVYIFLFNDDIKKPGNTPDKLLAFALGSYAHELRHFYQHIEAPNQTSVGYNKTQIMLDIDAYSHGAAALARITGSAEFKTYPAARQQAFKDAWQYQTDMMNFYKTKR